MQRLTGGLLPPYSESYEFQRMDSHFAVLVDFRRLHRDDAGMRVVVDRCLHLYFRTMVANEEFGRENLTSEIEHLTHFIASGLRGSQ